MKTDVTKRKEGLTLVELMVVTLIMAMLGMVVLGISGYASRRASESRAIADLHTIRSVLEEYRVQHGFYVGFPAQVRNTRPMTHSDFLVLTNYSEDLRFEDPWGHPYQYHLQGRLAYRVWSTGPSGPDEDYDYIE